MTLFLGLFLLVLMVVVTVLSAQREKDLLTSQIRDEGVALAHAYGLSAENALILDGAGLARVVGEASRIPEISYVIIVDTQRRVLAHSDPNHIGELLDDPTLSLALNTSIGAVDSGRTPFLSSTISAAGEEILVVVVPLVILDQVRGALEIGLGTDLIRQAAVGTSQSSLFIAVGAFLFGVAFIVAFSRSVTRPLEGLTIAADKIRAGTWDTPIEVPVEAAFSKLGQAMERMRLEVSSSFLQLRDRTAEVEELRRSSENILDSLTSGILSLNLEGRVQGMNRSARQMLSFEASLPLGGLLSEVLQPWPDLAQAFADVVLEEGLVREVVLNGRLLKLHTTSLREANRTVIGQLLVLEDLTFLRSLETRMRDAEKMAAMGELAAGMAHEVRNPLGSIRNAAQFLDGKWNQSEPRERFTKLIIEEVDRLNTLVNRLLQYTRAEKPGLEAHLLNESVDQAMMLAELRVPTSRICLVRDFADNLGPVMADPWRVVQLLLNLLFNAIESIPERGVITVRTESSASQTLVTVEDTGIGMDDETLARIGEPFFTTRATGTGLGVAIAKQIAEEHQAQLTYESKPGQGTKVRLAFPAC